jgi:hypothetical protein
MYEECKSSFWSINGKKARRQHHSRHGKEACEIDPFLHTSNSLFVEGRLARQGINYSTKLSFYTFVIQIEVTSGVGFLLPLGFIFFALCHRWLLVENVNS